MAVRGLRCGGGEGSTRAKARVRVEEADAYGYVGLIHWAKVHGRALFASFDAHDVVPRISTTSLIYFKLVKA